MREGIPHNDYEGEHVRGSADGEYSEEMYARNPGESDEEFQKRMEYYRGLSEMAKEDAERAEYEASRIGKYEKHLRSKVGKVDEDGKVMYTDEDVDRMIAERKASEEDKARLEEHWQALERGDPVDEFAGEHGASTSDFQIYPRLPGETSQQYGARLREIHEYMKMAEEDGEKADAQKYAESKLGKFEERLRSKLNEDGSRFYTDEEVASMVASATEREKHKGDEARYEAFLRERAQTEKDLGEAALEKSELEEGEAEKTREEMLDEFRGTEAMEWLKEAGIKAMGDLRNMSDEDLKALYDKWAKRNDKAEDNKEEKKEASEEEKKKEDEEKEKKPLIAVNLNRTRDAEAAARDIAERMLKEDLAEGNGLKKFIKGIWKGNMFRGYYIEKNRKKAYERILDKQNGKGDLGDDSWQSRSQATIDRFISEYDEMIHKDSGEWRNALPENHPATVAAKEAISKFAKGELDEENFNEEMKRVKALLKDADGNPKGDVVLDNYLEIARAAKGRFDHEEGIESIMEGFKLINGEARANVRTEAHRNALDKIMDRYEHSRFGRFLPPELVAGGASIGIWLATAGTKNALRAATFGFGGAAVTGLVAGLKEGTRVSTDRAQMAREAASGLEVDTSRKYDKAINATLYDMMPAAGMAGDLREAVESGDKSAIIRELALANTRIKMSDARNIDLISYSDPAKIEEERFALDLARAEALAKLRAWPLAEGESPDANTIGLDKALNELISAAEERFDDGDGTEKNPGIKARDKAFRSLRRKQMIKQGVKTGVVAAGTMVVSQEVVAAFSPDSYGLADEWLGLENNADAHNTMLAGMLGFKGPDGVEFITNTQRIDAEEAAGVKLSDEEVVQLREQGYTVNEIENTTMQSREVNLSAQEYAEQYGTRIARDDWAANGTSISDGNELSAHYSANGDGIVTQMSGNSTTWGGESINVPEAMGEGRVTALISLTGDTQTSVVEVAGEYVNGQMQFIPEAGSAAAECFQDGKFVGKYFEIVVNNGVGEDGVQHVIPLATVVGKGMEDAVFAGTESVPVTETVYNVIGFNQTVTEAVQVINAAGTRLPNPAALLPFVRRDNLAAARRREQTGETPTPEQGGGGPSGGGRQPEQETEPEQAENAPSESEQQPEPEQQPESETPSGEPAAPAEVTAPEEVPAPVEETVPENASNETVENPEGVPEGEPESTDTEPTSEGEDAELAEYDENGEPIWENMANLIGGESGLRIVRGDLDTLPEETRNLEFQAWWDGLTDGIKDRFAGRRGANELLSPESDALYDWLQETGKVLSAGEIYGDAQYEDVWNNMSEQDKENVRAGRAVLNNQQFVNWLRRNNIIPARRDNVIPFPGTRNEAPAEGENAAPQGETMAA